MALHGTISVNHRSIGQWEAQRVATNPDGNHTYEWRVSRDGHSATGTLTHAFPDGALALAAKVLSAAAPHFTGEE